MDYLPIEVDRIIKINSLIFGRMLSMVAKRPEKVEKSGQKWITNKAEIIIGVFIAGALSLIFIQLFSFSTKLSGIDGRIGYLEGSVKGLDSRLTDLKERVDRIAAVLPKINAQVAQEELSRPISGAIVLTKPAAVDHHKIKSVVHIIDVENKKRLSFMIDLAEAKDAKMKLTKNYLQGSALEIDPSAKSFVNYENLAKEVKKPIHFPDYIEKNGSFVVRNKLGNYEQSLKPVVSRYFGKEICCDIDYKIKNVSNLVTELDRNAKYYQLSKSQPDRKSVV